MAFTYDDTLSTDLSLVRFHIGDKNEKGHYLEDGEITYWLTEKASVGGAVIACIRYIITQLSKPDFRKDWLSVSNADARAGYEKLLKDKAAEFGISLSAFVAESSVSHMHRADSYEQDEEGNYEDPNGAP